MENAKRAKLNNDVLEVLKCSNKIVFDFKSRVENKVVVIFVGNTRSGKSTLVNYIADVPLIGVSYDDTFKIDTLSESAAAVGHGTLSRTTIPTVIELPKYPNTLIIDAPGFDDNRGAIQEILNALYINQIKHAKGVKFVLVSDVIDILTDNINNFLSFLETVWTIMPDFDKLQNATSIIFTKVSDEYTRESITELLKLKILLNNKLHCRRDLVEHFVEHPDLIGIFKIPHNAGLINYDLDDNIENAIFQNEPVDLNLHDIKFGVSREAKVVLLDAYLDFFDVRMLVMDVIKNFSELSISKLACLDTNQLLLLTDKQLTGPNNVLTVMTKFHSEIASGLQLALMLMSIPDVLSNVFVVEMSKVVMSLNEIQVEVNMVDDSPLDVSKIDEVHRHLEYLICIEKVVEMNNQSKSIGNTFKTQMELFYSDIKRFCNNIDYEIDVRKYLHNGVKKISDILPLLQKIDEQYLLDSMDEELLVMKNEATQYKMHVDNIVRNISCRPHLDPDLVNMIQQVIRVGDETNMALLEIEQHINLRVSGLLYFTNAKYATVPLIGMILLCFKSKSCRTVALRYKRRWQQNRVLRNGTILDGCCHDLLKDLM